MNEQEITKLYKWARPYECEFLYKYRSFSSEGLNDIFEKNQIYLPSPSCFNDPFDCHPLFTLPQSKKGFENSSHNLLKSQSPELTKKQRQEIINKREPVIRAPGFMEKVTQQFKLDTAVYSLSELLDNILMWSHYSDCHKGVCLEFKANVENTIFYSNYKVKYQKKCPVVNPLDLGKVENWLKSLAVKSDHWEYEEERRLIMGPAESGPGLYKYDPELLTSVILGACISGEDEEKVNTWVSKHETPINILRAKLNAKDYGITIT